MQSNFDEAKALLLLKQGSEIAFKAIYDHYAPGIYRVANRYFQSGEMAEDLVQEIFSTLWLKRAEFSEVQHFRFYLFTMARNLALKYLKKMAKDALINQEFTDRLSLTDDGTELYEERLRQAVEQLPPQQRQVFNLAKVNGLSHEDIALKLKLSPSTVNNHLVAALKFIRQHVPRHTSAFLYLLLSFDPTLFD
jgi:RNA polymerase sigma-70 factor (family 1)